MAESEGGEMAAAQDPADEQWVLMQRDGDAVTEVSLKEQDGDTRGSEEESIWDEAVRQESAPDTEKFLWWLRLAWNDVTVRNAVWNDTRTYVLGAILSVHAGLPFLVPLASMAPVAAHDTLQFMLTRFEQDTMLVLCAAAFSCTTRFVSLAAAKASTVKKLQMGVLLFALLMTNLWILLAACSVCLCEAFNTSFMGLVKALQDEHTDHNPHPLVFCAMNYSFYGAIHLAGSLAIQMCIDVKATFRAFRLHCREMTECWKIAYRSLEELYQKDKSIFAFVAMGIVTIVFAIAAIAALCACP